MIKVSIIIAYIDEHDYLLEAIASAAGQLDEETEIIVVCNAPSISSDYNPIPAAYKNVVLLHEPENGSAHARNNGLRHATGEWVQFLDVDDLLLEDKILHQMSNAEADVIVSPHSYLYLNGKRENSKWLPNDIWCGLLNSGLGSTSSMLWKRQAVLDAGGWNIAYQSHQEYELLFRLAATGKKIIPNDHCETVVRQRVSGSITSTTKSLRIREGIELREKIWNHLLGIGEETPERYEAFRQYVFRQLRGLFRQDKEAAQILFAKYFSKKPFTPNGIHVPGYRWMYKVFGFKRTEAIIQLIVSRRVSFSR
jgi:glycosyltransferase involved in cell wall biosynthesis